MSHNNYNSKIMAAVRAVLLIGGVLLGSALAILFFRENTVAVSEPIRIAIIASCGAVLGLFLMLSARPIVFLVLALGGKIKELVRIKRPEEIAGYALGIAFGLLLAFALYIGLTVLVPLPPLNIALTLVGAIGFSFVGAIVFSRVMSHEEKADGDSDNADVKDDFGGENGYIITSGAFFSNRAEQVLSRWLTGKLIMLESSSAVLGSGEGEEYDKALKLYGALSVSGKLKTVSFSKSGDETADIISYAVSRRLSIVSGSANEAALYEGKAKVLCLESL